MHYAMRKRNDKIIWGLPEWELLANGLATSYPERVHRSAKTIEDMDFTLTEFFRVMRKVLPEDRWRETTRDINKFKIGLIKYYQRSAKEAEKTPEVPPEVIPSPPEEFPAPPAVTYDNNHAVTVSDTAAGAPGCLPSAQPASVKSKKIFWKPGEWVDLAREINRLEPFAHHTKSTTLAGLTLAAFKEAERNVIAADRRRPSINSITFVRPDLLRAFAVIRDEQEQQQREEEERKAQERLEEQRRLAQEVLARKPNPYEEAFAPLVKFLATEITKMLVPALVTAQDKPQQTVDEIVAHATAVVENHAKPRKTRIAVVGPKPNQARELERTFPDLEIIVIEKKATAVSVQSADKIIGMTDFMDHSVDGMLRKTFPDRYHRTTGTVSSVKRLIGVLMASELYQQARVH